MTGEGEDEEEERGSCNITMCGSARGLKPVLLTQFVAAVHPSSTRINTECTSSFIFMLYRTRIAFSFRL